MTWFGEHHIFAVETFFKTGNLWLEHKQLFMLYQNDVVLERKSILLCIEISIQNSLIPMLDEMSTKMWSNSSHNHIWKKMKNRN